MTNQNWDNGMRSKTKDTVKVILRFIWDNPNCQAKQIQRFIGEDFGEDSSYAWTLLAKMRKLELVRQPYRAHYVITDEGMLAIGLTPKKPLLDVAEILHKEEIVVEPPMVSVPINTTAKPLQAPTIVKVEEVDELPIVTKEITLKLKIIVEVM